VLGVSLTIQKLFLGAKVMFVFQEGFEKALDIKKSSIPKLIIFSTEVNRYNAPLAYCDELLYVFVS